MVIKELIIQVITVTTFQLILIILETTLTIEINGEVTLVDLLEQLYSEVMLTEIVLLEMLVLTHIMYQVTLTIQEHTHTM